MNWKIKAKLQKILTRFPYHWQIYYLGQKYFGGMRKYRVEHRLSSAFALIESLNLVGERVQGWRTMEIGTGWSPILPIVLWLCGQEQCDTYDINCWMRPELIVHTIRQLDENRQQPNSALNRWEAGNQFVLEERLVQLASLANLRAPSDKILSVCNICYHAPGDAAQTGLGQGTVDLAFSNLVLGFIPLPALEAIFIEMKRIIHSGGYTYHMIDLADQHAAGQQSIGPINFLQYSTEEFEPYNTTFLYQSRLRAPAYQHLLEKYGFEIISWHAHVHPRALKQLPFLKIHTDFQSMSPEELCTTSVRVLARKK